MIQSNTPWETYEIDEREIQVKREDLCCAGASFSKLRGVSSHLRNIGASTIGVLDTRHSKAGWGVTYLATAAGKRTVVFYPEYKYMVGLRPSQRAAKQLGAELVGIPAGRSCILYHQAKKYLRNNFPDSYMMPNALKLSESVQETAQELIQYTPRNLIHDAVWVVSISSGTIGAGVIRGLLELDSTATVVLHCGYSRTKLSVIKYIHQYTNFGRMRVKVIDEGYKYADAVRFPCEFPCNPYYDLKAWKWLVRNLDRLNGQKIVFWNIGA